MNANVIADRPLRVQLLRVTAAVAGLCLAPVLTLSMWGASPAITIITALVACTVAIALADRALSRHAEPVARLADAIRHILDTRQYERRLPQCRPPSEVDALVRAFNRLLDELADRERKLDMAPGKLAGLVESHSGHVHEAEDAIQTKAQLLADVCHALRSRASVISGMCELLLETPLSHEQTHLARSALNAAANISGELDELLELSELESGKAVLEEQSFAVTDLLEAALSARARTASSDVEIAGHVAESLPETLTGDRHRVRQLLDKLLESAVGFAHDGEVTVLITNRSEDVPGRTLGQDEYAIVVRTVRRRPRMPAATKTQWAGQPPQRWCRMGFVRQLAQALGGRSGFAVDRSAASFWVALRSKFGIHQATRVPSTGQLAGKAVLVVHPVDLARAHIIAGLIPFGCVASGAAALPAAHGRYDVLLIDDSQWADLSPLTRPQIRIRLARVGARTPTDGPADALIAKPATHRDLHTAIVSALCAAEAHREDSLPTVGHSYRALVVDDDETTRLLARAMLETVGCTVVCASDGSEGAAAFKTSGPFDIVFMDCQMPVMDGYAATRAIRSWESTQPEGRVTPIIAVTANSLPGDRELCLRAGMTDYLTKPVGRAQYEGALHTYAARRSTPECLAES